MCRSGRSFALSAAQASSQWSSRCAKGCVNHGRSRADSPTPKRHISANLTLCGRRTVLQPKELRASIKTLAVVPYPMPSWLSEGHIWLATALAVVIVVLACLAIWT